MSKFSYLAKSFIIPAAANDGEVFDVEADNLLDAATAVHCIVIANVNGDKITEYGPQQIPAALNHLDRATRLIGHNISGYDLPLLEKLYGWRPKPGCVVLDTLIASRLILPHIGRLDDQAAGMGDPKLRELRGRHSLDAWAMRLDGRPKPGADIENFAEWSPELQERCVGDVMLTKKLFHFLQPTGYSSQALALEHSTAAVCDWISSAGVLFDITAAEQLGRRWEQRCTELAVAQLARVPELGKLTRPRLIAALLERGWAPEELTDNGNPSLKNNVLEGIAIAYPEFRDAAEYFALSWLLGNMTRGPSSWARHAQTDGRIHAKLLHIGQPHGRASCVSPNLHGVPSPKKGAKFGTECRTLFHAPDDWAMVAADMSNLQDRALAHYLAADGHNEHAQRYLSGEDMHWATTQALGLVDADAVRDKENPVHTALREGMKNFATPFCLAARPAGSAT